MALLAVLVVGHVLRRRRRVIHLGSLPGWLLLSSSGTVVKQQQVFTDLCFCFSCLPTLCTAMDAERRCCTIYRQEAAARPPFVNARRVTLEESLVASITVHMPQEKGAWERWFWFWFCFYGISAGIGIP